MDMPSYAATMARYNAWMNERLYAACAGLSDDVRKRDAGAFFKSIHGTLNHVLLADRVWLGRFRAQPFAVTSLAQELYGDFAELSRERAGTDAEITAWASALRPEDFSRSLSYVGIARPEPRTSPYALAIAHFFNHQTHHRGQVTTLLFQHGVDPGATDLIALPAAPQG
jgi:uncharacterized damage-inducible protein DinB